MQENQQIYLDLFGTWEGLNLSEEQLNHELTKKGFEEEKIPEIIKLYKKRRSDEKLRKGFTMMGIGAFIGFLSCLLTVLDVMPEFRGFILYGLTTIAITIAFGGCYLVFE